MRHIAILLLGLMLPLAAASAAVPPKAPLDMLFARLKQAGSPEEAKPIEEKIGGLFLQTGGGASVELLMTRAQAALTAGDKDTTKQLYDAIVDVAPDYAEGWHMRAVFQRANNDDAGAMRSLEHTILLNPRQFAAMYELGTMLEDYGNKDGALKLYRQALALDPQLEGAQKHVDALSRDVEGQGI
jgi:tetratricopeptide (TPR) repeat protein